MKSSTTTAYILKIGPAYVASFTQEGWRSEMTDKPDKAIQFSTMTLALCVGFCLGFGSGMEAVPYVGQLQFHLTDSL